MSQSDRVTELLRTAGLRQTANRKAILEALIQAGGPLSEQQILDDLPGEGINKTTIYRALASFVQTGIVHQAYIKERTAYYELGHRCSHHQCHPHFTCNQCGKTECLTGAHLPLAELEGGFTITRQKVELEGICPNCQNVR